MTSSGSDHVGVPNLAIYVSYDIPSRSGPGSCSPQPASIPIGIEPRAGAMICAVSTARGKLLDIKTVAETSRPVIRRSRNACTCRRPKSVRPVQVLDPPRNRSTVARDWPWRINTSRVFDTATYANFSTNASNWRRLRHS